jgi:uracil-DNA glycosylase
LYLEHELSAIEPKLAVTFGKDPWCFLMRDNPAVKTCTGFTGRPYLTPRYNFVIWPLFHPGMLLHDPLKYKAKMEEDFGVLYTFCRDRGYLGPLAKPL